MSYTFYRRKFKPENTTRAIKDRAEGKQQLPNSLVSRIMEDPGAEREAERLSQGISASTPDEVLREMSSRLDTDLSSVQFHSDPLSQKRSQALGARAWAQGRNIYFGTGGFDADAAAHELVHTVQQGSIRGNVSQSMPAGTVQLLPHEDDDDTDINQISNNMSNLELMMRQYNSGNLGRSLFDELTKPVRLLAEKSGNRPRRKPNAQNSIQYLSLLGEQDYSGKEILRDIAARDIQNKHDMYNRQDEYEGFMDFIEKRTDKPLLEQAAFESGILTGQPIHQFTNHQNNKRAYEFSAEEIQNGAFNPQNNVSVKNALDAIDAAKTAKEAYLAFVQFTGTSISDRERQLNTYYVNMARDKNFEKVHVDPAPLKKKLKNMVRQIRDYPELRGKIGGMTITWSEKDAEGKDVWGEKPSEAVMSATTVSGLYEKAGFRYDAYLDSPANADQRDHINQNLEIGTLDSVGNHELGHVLAANMNDDEEAHHMHEAEDSILKTAAGKVMPEEQLPLQKENKLNEYNKPVFKGHVDTEDPMFKPMTSSYGQSQPPELFAEAFNDVYTKGSDAKPLSIEIVKEYERRQTVREKANFQKKEPGFFRKMSRWFSTLFGAGRNEPLRRPPIISAPNKNDLPLNLGAEPGPDLPADMVVNRPKRKRLKKKRKA